MRELTDAILRRDFGEALRLCAEDAGAVEEPPRILRVDVHYKSTLAYIGAEPGADQPSHVIKIDESDWNPEREFAGLAYTARVFEGTPAVGTYRLGSIVPVGYGRRPPFLASRFQHGRSIRPMFDRAVHTLRKDGRLAEASACSRALAEWLLRFRSEAVRPGEGPGVEGVLTFCRDRTAEIGRFLGAETKARAVTECLERLITQIDDGDRQRLADAFPAHGDLAPQNFSVDEEGTLYAFDFEDFCHGPMDPDLAGFRMRLEHYALGGPVSRARSATLWRAFFDVYTSGSVSPEFALLCYIHQLLAHLAWQRNPKRLKMRGTDPFRQRVKIGLWIRQRLRWFRGLRGDIEVDGRYFRDTL